MKQIGISPKVIRPFILQVLALLVTFVEAGDFGETQFIQLGVLIVSTALGYISNPGKVA
jgi:hypothetical protein